MFGKLLNFAVDTALDEVIGKPTRLALGVADALLSDDDLIMENKKVNENKQVSQSE